MLQGQSLQTGRNNPEAPLPPGLNPRLQLVRETLTECLKTIYGIRERLGIPEPPDNAKSQETPSGSAGITMDLLAQSGRLKTLLMHTIEEIG